MRRDVVKIPLGEHLAIGTCHLPAESTRNTAVVLLNAGHVPRNGHGGFARHLADCLCSLGWPVLRIDLPGLGDAPGPLPEQIETFWIDLKDGGHAAWAAEVARWAAEVFSVDRVCLGGVCGAAVTALFAADKYPSSVHALFLAEPELFTTDPGSNLGVADAARQRSPLTDVGALHSQGNPDQRHGDHQLQGRGAWWNGVLRLTSSWRWMRALSKRRSRLPLANLVQQALLRFTTSKSQLPARTNVPLMEAWSRVSGRGTPTLIMTAQGLLWETYFVSLKRRLLGSSQRHATHVSVSGANHVFSNEAAKTAVTSLLPRWLESQAGR